MHITQKEGKGISQAGFIQTSVKQKHWNTCTN